MTVFHYVAIDQKGHSHKGTVEGDSSQQVLQQLKDQKLFPLEIKSVDKKINPFNFFARRAKLARSKLYLFTYQLGTLLSAGLSIEVALLNIIQQMDKTPFKVTLMTMHTQIMEGQSFAQSMENFPDIFPTIYRKTISAGEKSGQLDKVINQLTEYLDQQEVMRQQIQQATIYPVLLTLVSIGIIVFLLSYAMPKITDVFAESGQKLPGMTILLLNISNTLNSFGLYILLLLGAVFFWFKHRLKQIPFRLRVQRFLLKIPVINKTLMMINATRFARTLGILFSANVPVIDAMQAANQIIFLLPMQEAIRKAIIQVGEGMSIHKALAQTGYFTRLSTQLIASGEVSGKLEVMLEKTAQYQEQNMSRWIKTVLSLFEPAMILFMGAIVLFIVLAILLPIFELNQLVGA